MKSTCLKFSQLKLTKTVRRSGSILSSIPVIAWVMFSPLSMTAQYNVVLGTDNVPIKSISITRNGVSSTQTSGNKSTIHTKDAIILDSMTVQEGLVTKTLKFIDYGGALVVNNNFTSSVKGVGVYNKGAETLASNKTAWENEMVGVLSNRNILHYLFYDGSSNIPSGPDFDINWTRGITNDDYFVVSERDGNTFFTVTPLGIDGNPIVGARSLRFGHQTGTTSTNGNNKYDWNTRYASTGRHQTQPQYMTVVDINLFNTSSTIYGLRINNNGDADVKFYAFSDSTFTNNPPNPKVSGLSGNIFNDLDGATDNKVDGNPVYNASGTDLYVSLLQNGGIVETTMVQPDGSYEFLNISSAKYTTVLHTTSGGSMTPSLPQGWVNTGENHGAGTGSDGLANGASPIIDVQDTLETQVNFGIVQLPNTVDKTYSLNPSPIMNSVRSLIAIDGMGPLDGDDPSGVVFGAGSTFVITDTVGMQGNVLFYDDNTNKTLDPNEGINPNDTIKNYDPVKLSVAFKGLGSSDFSFKYASVNAANFADSTPATYSANWSIALPVTWLNFEAVSVQDQVMLNWSTATEVNNSHFEIERSSDRVNWIQIGEVKGQMYSTQITNYDFMDVNPGILNYYQIKQVDFNGTSTYSATQSVVFQKALQVQSYPNPAENTISVKIKNDELELIPVTIVDHTGKIRLQTKMTGDQTNINISKLNTGVYYIRIKDEVLKFVKL